MVIKSTFSRSLCKQKVGYKNTERKINKIYWKDYCKKQTKNLQKSHKTVLINYVKNQKIKQKSSTI